jgi:hypothetical protein
MPQILPSWLATYGHIGMALEPTEEEEYTSLERAESVVRRHARLRSCTKEPDQG